LWLWRSRIGSPASKALLKSVVAADRRKHQAADDHLSFEEAALGRARADDLVEGEDLSRLDDRSVDEVRHQVDVVDAVRGRRAHVGREGREPAADPEGLRFLRRQLGGTRVQRQIGGAVDARVGGRGERVGHGLVVDVDPVPRRDDPDDGLRGVELRVPGPLPPRVDEPA
jgi:hypothetical protein